jgi:hypothetical protein
MKAPDGDVVDTDVLREELERALGETGDISPRIARLARRASRYRTSFALEELEVFLEDGRHLRMLWKDLHRHSLGETARQVKPEFLYNPAREIEMYRQVLAPHRFSTPTFYGAVVRPEEGRYWLFLERVAGRELYQIGDFRIWQQVARWLAGMHVQFRGQAKLFQRDVPLIVHDSRFYRHWMTRARQFAVGTKAAIEIEWVAQRHNQVIDRLLALGPTLLHGEFYASNILVVPQANSLRVCPVDWEMAAIGPGLMDLGALVAGHWSEEKKRELASAHYSALPTPRELSCEEFLEALDYCRLQIAVQWLGWSPGWSPPPEQAQDWLFEAISLAEKLKL